MNFPFYITTAIDYVNDRPHIGHALEKIQADVIARYRRLNGERVWFLTGTDEHGIKILRAAQAAGKNPQEFVNQTAEGFRALRSALNLSWDDFIRTSDRERHWPGAQALWMRMLAAGDLYKKQYRGLYCVGHEAFVTEKDLVDGKCRDHQRPPELIEEENWFFRLSRYAVPIAERIDSGEFQIFPETRRNEIRSLIGSGLEDVSFSRPARTLLWGIPVPNDPDHVMYVWCDALANYITAVGYGRDEKLFEQWWPAAVHVIGKDILRFHAAIWPAMLLSAGLPLPRSLFVHGFITVDGQKMSKTVGNVADPLALVERYGVDPVRYFLLREIPAGADGDFSTVKLEERYEGDLANGLGNLVSRVAALGERVNPVTHANLPAALHTSVAEADRAYQAAFERYALHEALGAAWQLVGVADRFINDTKPWAISDEAKFRSVVSNAGLLVHHIARFVGPFMPQAAANIRAQIAVDDGVIAFKKGAALFPRRS